MTIITSYPGVYVSEDASLNLAVSSSATAVPVFAYFNDPGNGISAADIFSFNTWSDFKSFCSNPSVNYPGMGYYRSVYTWFKGGGGKCYLAEVTKLKEAIETYSDITLLVAAGATTGTKIYDQFNELTSHGYPIFGLFDGPGYKIDNSISDSIMNEYPVSAYGALFYPWCRSDYFSSFVPPSTVAAVSIAQTDRSRGVWKAPANQPIIGITPMYPVSDELQEKFSGEKPLNMIRSFPETGTVIWGARTLENSDNWRFIPVRRLFNMVEKDIKSALSRIVFESNNQPTWQRIKTAIDNYLRRLWEQGALMGEKPEEAWFVQIGKGITMTEEDIRQRKIILKIGLAAVRPAVFIHLKFTQDVAQ